jgi:hypothetical protein
MIYGPIQSMDEDRTLLWRLFHTGWIGRLVHSEARPQFVPPACATVQLIPAARGASEVQLGQHAGGSETPGLPLVEKGRQVPGGQSESRASHAIDTPGSASRKAHLRVITAR